ncbi:SUN domain-containing ossification factor isoform X2 [Cryptotermes secundus]|nr:SUN domain-containing ossification factor isoform X2 [Cryptotermes secundus]
MLFHQKQYQMSPLKLLEKNRLAMVRPVCSLKELASPPTHLSSCDKRQVLHWSRRASFRLLQVALLYLTVTWIVWAFPPLCDWLSETGQGVIFTVVDTAAAEFQDHVSSPSHHHTKGLLRGIRNDNLTVDASPGETQIVRPPISDEDESLTNSEETSKNLSILEDTVDDKIFKEKGQQYIVRAEPKVIEMKLQVHTEKPESMLEEIDSANIPETAAVINDSAKNVVDAKEGDLKLSPTEDSEQTPAPDDIPSFSEWAQKQLAEAEKKKIQNSTTPPAGSQSRASGNLKVRSKNYASPDCGAKIVGTNPEAMYAGSIISPSRDEYVLNACTNRFWFVVELCEAIQAKKIDLANFELFSSSPRDFSVSLSDRFPTRDWRSVGHFTAQDERDIQSFNLDPHLFGKFIKVELHSHYGSEHYCPVSLFRVYGTSEFEVLETEVEVHESLPNMADDDDDDDEEPLDVDTGELPKTLFGSAQDAVMSIVKKAAQALVKSGNSQNETTNVEIYKSHSNASGSKNCVSPSHIVVCDNCSDAMFSRVFELLSCRGTYLQSLIETPFVRSSFQSSKLCVEYGLDFSSHRTGAPYPLRLSASGVDLSKSDRSRYLSALLPSEYIAALCNILAVLERKVVFNISYEVNGTTSINITNSLDGKSPNVESDFGNLVVTHHSTCTLGSSLTSEHCSSSSLSGASDTVGFATSLPLDSVAAETTVASQIKPTRTLVKEPDRKEDFPSAVTMKTSYDQGKESSVFAEVSSLQELPAGAYSTVSVSVYPGEENRTDAEGSLKERVETQVKTSAHNGGSIKVEVTEELPTVTESDQQQSGGNEKQSEVILEEKYQESQENLSLDSLLSELKDLDIGMDTSGSSSANPATVTATTVSPPSLSQTQQVQKESVFVRLSNRIKALERNMSLSGQYLEELSRRYKKQVEEMQRAFNRTLAAVAEESRKGEEREQKRVEEMAALQKQLATLTFSVEMLLTERDSWQHKAAVIIQHVVLILIEMLVFGIVLYFCRHLPETDVGSAQRKWSFGWHVQRGKESKTDPNRRRSVQGVSGHEAPKSHNRRPSEEALNISGTYRDLLIESHVGDTGTIPKIENKRRRRKRKCGLQKSSSSANISSQISRRFSEYLPGVLDCGKSESESVATRRASSSELGKWWNVSNGTAAEEDDGLVHQHSVPDPLVTKHHGLHSRSQRHEVLSVTLNGSSYESSALEPETPPEKQTIDLPQGGDLKGGVMFKTKEKLCENVPILCQGNGSVTSTGPSSKVQRLSSPIFMKTAMSARSNRIGNNLEQSPKAKLKSDNWEWYSSHCVACKSSQGPFSTTSSATTLHNGSEDPVNGHFESEDLDRTSESGGTQDLGGSQRNNVKKMRGGSGLKKMVKKFF